MTPETARASAAVACAVAVALMALPAQAGAPHARAAQQVVIAVVDNGINAYHGEFAAPAQGRPGIGGYPSEAKPLRLSLRARTYNDARVADDAAWARMREGHLYYLPGTKIAGLIRIPARGPQDSANQISVDTAESAVPRRPVIDHAGHGTSVASLAVGNRYGACPRCLLVFVSAGNLEDGLRWAGSQSWIDVVTNSWGGPFGAPTGGTAGPVQTTGAVNEASRLAAASGKAVFFAAGNGVSGTGPYAGAGYDRSITWASPYSGPPWVTAVGASRPDGQPTDWHDVPADVLAQGQDVSAARAESLDGTRVFYGTSAATPLAAGTAAEALLRARLAARAGRQLPGALLTTSPAHGRGPLSDGRLTRAELVDAVLRAATPVADGRPDRQSVAGWGNLDSDASGRAAAILLGTSAPPRRPDAETWHDQNMRIRSSLWGDAP